MQICGDRRPPRHNDRWRLQKMVDTILVEGPGFTIAQSDLAETLVPYGPADREDGNRNYGWIDLRDRPNLVSSIPEAQKSAGLSALLSAIADPSSAVMSGACDCHAFDHTRDTAGEPGWLVGGYVEIMFKDSDRNRKPVEFDELARFLLSGISGSDQHHVAYEFIIEPLKSFFGAAGCYGLMAKALGVGIDEDASWAAFDHGMRAMATSLVRNRK
jgi:hypothetical protein